MRRRLISSRLRPAAIVVVVAAGVAVGALGAHNANLSYSGPLYRPSRGWLVDHQRLAHDVVNLGSPEATVAASLLLAVASLLLRRPRGALLAVLAPQTAGAISEWVLKPLIRRSRGGELAFPSGHSTGAFAVALVVVVLVLDQRRPRLPVVAQALASAAVLAAAVAVATASVAVGDHYASDTLGGAGVAVATVLTVGLAVDLIADARAADAAS